MKYNINKTIWGISLFLQAGMFVLFYSLTGNWMNYYTSYTGHLFGYIVPNLYVIIYLFLFISYFITLIFWTYLLYRKKFNPLSMPKRLILFNILFLITGSAVGLLTSVSMLFFKKIPNPKNNKK